MDLKLSKISFKILCAPTLEICPSPQGVRGRCQLGCLTAVCAGLYPGNVIPIEELKCSAAAVSRPESEVEFYFNIYIHTEVCTSE